jgi:hypothetical protein
MIVEAVSYAGSAFQIARVEAFCKPTVNQGEKVAGLLPLTMVTPDG